MSQKMFKIIEVVSRTSGEVCGAKNAKEEYFMTKKNLQSKLEVGAYMLTTQVLRKTKTVDGAQVDLDPADYWYQGMVTYIGSKEDVMEALTEDAVLAAEADGIVAAAENKTALIRKSVTLSKEEILKAAAELNAI